MSRRSLRASALASALVLGLLGLVLASRAAGDRDGFPDPAVGQIDGKIAVAAIPVDARGEPSLPLGFRAHLVPESDPDVELVFPAGRWFQPDKGRYKVWLEGEDVISPSPAVINYSASPFEGRGMLLALPTVAAGRARLGSWPSERALTLRLLHLDSHDRDGVLAREFSRRVRGRAAIEGVQVPAGRVVGALFDDAAQEYVALTHPAPVTSGMVTTLLPEAPARGSSDLVAVLERPWQQENASRRDFEVRLTAGGGGPRPPNVLVVTVERLYAVWYDLPSGTATVTANGHGAELPATELRLRSGRIESLRGALAPLPSLGVRLDLPAELMQLDPMVDVRVPTHRSAAAERKLSRPDETLVFPALPRASALVRLTAGPWTFLETVDLATGPRHEVVFAPWPIHLHGTVYSGETPKPAEVAFQVGDREQVVSTRSDENGDYAITLFRPGRLIVAITLAERGGVPYYEWLEEPVRVSGRRDFHLPDNEVSLLVLDGRTEQPVADAMVGVMSRSSDTVGGMGLSFTTDESGRVSLPPLYVGELAVEVVAEGYETALVEAVAIPDEPGFSEEVKVRLRPERTSWKLQLVDARHVPAQQAEVAAVASGTGELFWTGKADSSGRVALPDDVLGSLLLIRHQGSSLLARRWNPSEGEEMVVWNLAPAAGSLVAQVLDVEGRPRPFCPIALRMGGELISGLPLGWSTGTTAATDRDGLWSATNLPSGQALALAAMASGEGASTGSSDWVAVQPASPEVVRLQAP